MVSITEMHEQNHEIAELAKTLDYLFKDREMCDTSITCELLERYQKKFDQHIDQNTEIYSTLLKRSDGSTRRTVERFVEGDRELKRIFNAYTRKWCKGGFRIDDYEAFLEETDKMFGLVWDRIQAESEQLYPLYKEDR